MPVHTTPDQPLYTLPVFQQAAGDAWRPGGLTLTARYVDACGFAAGARVVDMGCGTGATVRLLQEKGLRAVGLDSKFSPSIAESLPQNTCLPAHYVQADAAQAPFRAGSLDGLVCECVLSLLPEQDSVISLFHKLLRTDGVLLLADIFVRDNGQSAACTASAAASLPSPTSCMHGAVSCAVQEARLRHAGFHITQFADHSQALKDLAARLVWYGTAPQALRQWMGASTVCSRACSCAVPRFGYGVWIAMKETKNI